MSTDPTLVRLAIFEGPIELLLYLIRKREIDIFDVPIAQLTDDYLNFLRSGDNIDLAQASDFLALAAVLLRLKVRALLPRPPEEDLTPPQVSLEQILDAYRQFQQVANILREKEAASQLRFPRRGGALPVQWVEGGEVLLLTRAFARLIERFSPPTIEVPRREVRLEDKIAQLRNLLATRQSLSFEEAVVSCETQTLSELIVLFLALLELVRLGEIRVEQEGEFGPIEIQRKLDITYQVSTIKR